MLSSSVVIKTISLDENCVNFVYSPPGLITYSFGRTEAFWLPLNGPYGLIETYRHRGGVPLESPSPHLATS